MAVDFDEQQLTENDIVIDIRIAGYSAQPVFDAAHAPTAGAAASVPAAKLESPTKKLEATAHAMKRRLITSFVFWIPLFYIGMGHMIGLPVPAVFADSTHSMTLALTELVLTLPILYVNRAYFINGFKSLAHGAPTMDALIAVGATASVAWSLYAMFLMAESLATGDVHTAHEVAMNNLYFESAGNHPHPGHRGQISRNAQQVQDRRRHREAHRPRAQAGNHRA